MFYAILATALVVLDQLVKYLVRANINEYESVPFIPYLMKLTHVPNTGGAWSILESHTWLLTLASAAVVLAMCWLIMRGFFQNALGRWAAALVLAGGMGNLIDRVVFGAVTDMFQTIFIDFPIFNVADCCITVGVPLLFLYVWLYVDRDEKEAAPGAEREGAGKAEDIETGSEPEKEDEADDPAQLPPDGG